MLMQAESEDRGNKIPLSGNILHNARDVDANEESDWSLAYIPSLVQLMYGQVHDVVSRWFKRYVVFTT